MQHLKTVLTLARSAINAGKTHLEFAVGKSSVFRNRSQLIDRQSVEPWVIDRSATSFHSYLRRG